MTDGMTRLGALLRGELPDRVPVVLNVLEQGARLLGMSIREYYSKGENVARGQLLLRERYGHDNVWSTCYLARDAELLGSKRTIFSEEGPPQVGHLIVGSEREIETLRIPDDVFERPAFQEEVETIRLLRREVGGRYPILSSVTGSFSMPPLLMGIDGWLTLLLTGPERLARRLLERCSEFCVRKIAALRAAGVDLIAYVNPVASATFLTVSQFRTMALEWVKRDFGQAGTAGIVYFSGGGRLNPILDTLLTETDVGAVHVSPADDVGEARRIIAGRALLAAAINDIGLIRWSHVEIDAEVRRIMEAGAPGGGFLFGTLVMPWSIPDDSIAYLVEAAQRHGSYDR